MKDSLLRYLDRERLAERRVQREIHSLPLHERVECGEAIAGATVVSQGGGIYVIYAAEHGAKFREGDLLWLGDGENIDSGAPVRLVKYDPAARELTLEHDDRESSAPVLHQKIYVLDRRSMELGERFATAIESIFRKENHPIAVCLDGLLATDDDERVRRLMLQNARERGLDRSQAEAFSRALARPKLHLIQGPPGTGKTKLIGEIVDACISAGERVAVIAYTHRAVDQVLLKCAACSDSKKVYKLDSNRTEASELTGTGVKKISSIDKVATNRDPWILGMTTHAAARAAEKGLRVDRVIFDESGQIPIPHAISAMRLAEKWLFVGDHAQLPPVVAGEHVDEHKISIFEHLVSRYPSTMLETTYRMNTGICAFPSKQFYNNALSPSPDAASRLLSLKKGGRFRKVFDPKQPAVFVQIDHCGAAMRSRREAIVAAELLLELMIHHRFPASEIAAIAPFRAQVMAIREQLERRAAKCNFKPEGGMPLVETVERIQGREREIVIISFASSDPDWLATQSSFYYLPNRLNVALTRARSKCIIVASPLAFDVRARTLKEAKTLQLFRELRESLSPVSGHTVESEIDA
ncbi:MAG: DEAD/DEAH box helicase [Planctomycetota bacterium]